MMEQARMSTTIGRLFDSAVAARGDASFLFFDDRSYTYAETKESVDRVARGLLSLGFKKGDHIAVLMGNSPEWVFVQQAVCKIGCVLIPLNTHSVGREISYMIRQSDAVGLVFENHIFKHDFIATIKEMGKQEGATSFKDAIRMAFPELRCAIGLGDDIDDEIINYEGLLSMGDDVEPKVLEEAADAVSGDDLAMMIYTSGTTGFPKGALLQHKSICFRARVFADWYELGLNDVGFYCQPFYHIFGCVAAIESALVSGGALFSSRRFDATEGLEAIQRCRCTMLFCVPAVLDQLLHHPRFDEFDVSSMRVGVVSGAPAPAALVTEAKERFVPRLAAGYGCTECCAMTNATRLDDSVEITTTKVGLASESCEVKIMGMDSGLPLPLGREGEICVRSEYNMVGYYKMEEETKLTIDRMGFLHTGDVGRLDEDGYLALTGRKKDIVIVGGVNVYPAEVENVLAEYPGVRQSQVVGVSDDRLGEVPLAFVILEDGYHELDLADLYGYCRSVLSNFKVPKYVRYVESFPMTGSGKPQKKVLREMALDDLDKRVQLY